MSVETEISHLSNADQQQIFCKTWKQEGNIKPRALVFILHGGGEHCQVYDVLAEPLARAGCLVCAHDHIGHGASEGDRYHVNNASDYTRDSLHWMDTVTAQYAGTPVFVLGHSMGGLVAVSVGLERPQQIQGMILIGPLIHVSPASVSPFKMYAARLLSWVMPWYAITSVEPTYICHDPNIVQTYNDDPLVIHSGVKVRFLVQFMDLMEEVKGRLSEVTWPLLTIHGDQDKLTEVSGSKALQQEATSLDKTLQVVEGAYHQVHNEPDGVGEQCVRDIVDWVQHRL